MKILKLCETGIIAEISKEDLSHYCLNFNKFNIEEPQVQILICDLLEKSNIKPNKKANSIFIDTFINDFEMYIVVTLHYKKKYKVIKHVQNKKSVLLQLFDENALIDLMKNDYNFSSIRLFEFDKSYYAEICQKGIDNFNLKQFLSEFGIVLDDEKLILSYLFEHSTPIYERFTQ